MYMRPISRINKKYCVVVAVALLAALNNYAAIVSTWTNNAATGNWSTAANWDNGIPTSAGDAANFTANYGTAAKTFTIDTTSRTVGLLNIGDPSASYWAVTIANSGGAALVFDNNGAGALLSKPSATNTALDVISAPITLADNLTIDTAVTVTNNSGNSIQISGVISESGSRSLTKNGVGGIYLNGANTFSGGTILNAGEIQFNNAAAFGTGRLTVNGGSLAARTANRTLTNAMMVGGDFTFNSADAGGNSLTLTGDVDLGAATRTITVASTANPSAFMSGIISGGNPGVGIIKAGPSVFNISGANTFSGDTRIAAGNLQLSLTTGAPAGTSLSLQNSTVDLNAADTGTLSFRGSVGTVGAILGGLKGSRNLSLINSSSVAVALTVGNNNQSTTYSGALSGSGGTLTKIGNGTLILSGANTYDGSTTISGGSLQLGDGGSTGSLFGSGFVQDDGNLTINRNNAVVQGVDFGGGSIGGSGSFTQAGSGTTTLTLGNNYSGATTVSGGKLVVDSQQASAGAVSLANGTTLGVVVTSSAQWQPASLTLGTSTLEFNGVANAGTTSAPLNPGSVTRNGAVTVHVKSISGAITVGGSGYPLVGNVGGSATGYTLGTQPPGVGGHLATSGNALTFVVDSVSDIWNAASPGGNWDILTTADWTGNAANNTPANTFKNGDNVLLNDTVAGPQTVTLTAAVTPGRVNVDNTATDYSIVSSGANNIGGASGLAKSGTGALTLSGPNTYSGGTTLGAGQLNINDGGTSSANSPIGTGPLTISGGALGNTSASDVTLLANIAQNWNGNFGYAGSGNNLNLGTGPVTLSADRQINVTANTLTVGGVISGAASLTKIGNGTLTLNGENTFSGGMTVAAGQLNLGTGGMSSANSAIGTGPLTLTGGAIDNTSGGDMTLLPNNAQVWGGSFTYAGSANNLNLGTGPVTLTATPTVTVSAGTLTVGGVISGAFGLTKSGSGTLALMNANVFTGNSVLSQGVLALGSDFALGTGSLSFSGGLDGATIQSTDGTARTITNAITFGGSAGTVTIFGGTGNLKFTGSAANSSAKTMIVNNPVTEFSGVLSGAMARTYSGTGKLILSGANTYSQGTTISPGATVQLGNGGTTGSLSASGVIDDEGTLIFNRSDALVQGTHFSSSPIVGGGSVIQAGSGTVTLNAANTYSGLTMVNNGELFITPAYQAGGDVNVANGASFGVSASSVSNSATMGNLTLGAGGATTLDFSYGFTGNPTNAALVANTVTVNGASSIRIGGTFVVGTFPVLRYGNLSGAFQSTVVGPRGVTATLSNDTANHIIYVTVSSVGSGIVWTGTNNISPNLWDLNTTANWLFAGSATPYLETVPPGDPVTFNDLGSGTVLVSNTVSPANVTISNTLVNYAIQGSGQINSASGLNKSGNGTVTLNVPGTFSGSTVISNGTLSIGANQTFANLSGNSAVTVSTGTPTLTVNESSNTTFSGNMSGATLTKIGNGVLTLTGSNNLSVNLFAKAGGLILDSGSITANSYVSIGQSGTDTGTLTLKGTANFTGNNDLNAGDTGSSVGTINIQDNANVTVNAFYIGSANAASSTASGTVNQTGGTVTQLNTTAGTFAVGGRTDTTSVGGVGIYNMSGGTLTIAAPIRVGSAGSGTFNQSGGFVDSAGDVNIARLAGSSGTYNLDGGRLRAPRVTSSTAVNAIFNFNGGILIPTGNNTTFFTNLSQVNIRNGGAIFDTTNFNVTIASTMQHSSIGGDNAVDGGLTKIGNGTLTLAASYYSSYTGPTVVMGGALNLNPNSIATLNNLIVSNATLGLAFNYNTSPGTFNAASVNLIGNSALNINYDLLLGSPSVALAVSGGITASGTTKINLNGYGFTPGQYPLVTYNGTPLANLNNFTLGALPVGVTASLVNNTANKSIDLVINSVANSSWIPLNGSDAAGTTSFNLPGHWLNASAPSAGNGYFTSGYLLRTPADNSAYTFGGDILAVDAGGELLFKGTDGQLITVNNLVLNGGLLVFGVSVSDNFTETLAGNITLQPGTTSSMGANGSATTAETLNITAPIGGAGNLVIGDVTADIGTIALGGNNTYTGATTVTRGTLLVNGTLASTPVTISATGTLGGTGNISGSVTVQSGGTLAPGIPSRGALTAAVGTLTAGNTTVNGTVQMRINRGAVPASDKLVASSVTVNAGSVLTVTNIGDPNLVVGDTFTLFSAPVSGAFTTLNLPPLPDGSVMWTNRLAIDGTIAVVAASTVNTSSPIITISVSGGNLTLSWPADHTGWTLQMQTNSLGTNWVDVPGSTSTNSVTLPVGTGTVFYRLKL